MWGGREGNEIGGNMYYVILKRYVFKTGSVKIKLLCACPTFEIAEKLAIAYENIYEGCCQVLKYKDINTLLNERS